MTARIGAWLRKWATLPARWRRHEEEMRRSKTCWAEFSHRAIAMGCGDLAPVKAAVEIAKRCQGAEWELKRVATRLEGLQRERRLVQDMAGPPYLSPAEMERLAKLAEEAGELVRAVGKVMLHGWESASPYTGRTNREALEREIGSVRAMVGLMLDADDVRLRDLQSWQRVKRAGLARWMHHQAGSPTAEEQLVMLREIEAAQGMER